MKEANRLLLYISLYFTIIVISGCESETTSSTFIAKMDSISKAKIFADSMALVKQDELKKAILTIKPNKTVKVSDKKITVVVNVSTTNELKFEYEFGEYNNYFRSKIAQRDEVFMAIRIKLFSESKWNNSGSKFLPELNVFRINESNLPELVGQMTYQLYKKSDRNFYVLESIFDYQDSEVFYCWFALKKPISGKYIISANSAGNTEFDISTVFAVLNEKK
jgi:hypothetical protein